MRESGSRTGSLRVSSITRALVLGVLLSCAARPALADPAPPSRSQAVRLHAERGLLSVDVQGVTLEQILELLAEQLGASVTLHGDASARVTESFSNLPIDEGLRRLLRHHSLALLYVPLRETDGAPALTRVIVVTASTSSRSGAAASPGRETRTFEPRRAPDRFSAGPARGGVGSAADSPTAGESARSRAGAEARGAIAELATLQERIRQGDPGAVTEIAELLAPSHSPLVRAQAAALLGVAGGGDATAALRSALSDTDGAVRLHAVRAFGQVERGDALPVMKEVIDRDPDPRVRRMAVRWIGAFPGAAARAALEAATSDLDPSVRQEAAAALASPRNRTR